MGWVESIEGETVHVIQDMSLEMLEENQRYHIKVDYMLASATSTNFTHRNSKFILRIKVTSTAVFHALPPVIPGDAGPSSLARANHIPWLGQTILITKIKHPFKGHQAVVKNVLCNQDTISGLRIVV